MSIQALTRGEPPRNQTGGTTEESSRHPEVTCSARVATERKHNSLWGLRRWRLALQNAPCLAYCRTASMVRESTGRGA